MADFWPFASTSQYLRGGGGWQQDSNSPPTKKLKTDAADCEKDRALKFHLKCITAIPGIHLGFAAAKVAEFIGQRLSDEQIDKNIDKLIEYQDFIHSGINWSKSKKLKNTIGQMYLFLMDHYFQEKMQKFPDVDPYFLACKIKLGNFLDLR